MVRPGTLDVFMPRKATPRDHSNRNGVSSEADSKGEPASEVYGEYSLISSGLDDEKEEGNDDDDGSVLGMRMKSRKDESTTSERMFGDEQGRG